MELVANALSHFSHLHELRLVMESLLVAMLASYVALELAGRMRVSTGRVRAAWLVAASIAIGGGIWSMHFLAMLGLRLPFVVTFSHALTGLSLLIAILFCALGFYIVFWREQMTLRLLVGGAAMGLGVAAMHYVGMAALRLPVPMSYNATLVALSLVVAVVAATAALWLSHSVRKASVRLLAAPVMAAAIAGMHFTGMAALELPFVDGVPLNSISSRGLSVAIIAISGSILLGGLALVYHDQRMQHLAQMALAQFGIYAASSDDFDAVVRQAVITVRKILRVDVAKVVEVDLHARAATVTTLDATSPTPMVSTASPQQFALLEAMLTVRHMRHVRPGQLADESALFFGREVPHGGMFWPILINASTGLLIGGFSKAARDFTATEEEALRTQGRVLAVLKERQINANQLRLRDKALETISQGITVTDQQKPGAPIVYANPAFSAMTGLAPNELIGRKLLTFVGPDSKAAQDSYREQRSRGGIIRVELDVLRKDGSTFLDRMAVSPLTDEHGLVTYHVAVHDDVTDERRREQQLREMRKLESIGQLTGGIAHEFNNLLTVITSNAEDLEDQFADRPLAQRQLGLVRRAAERGADLVRQLLTFARKQQAHPTIVNVATTLGDFETLLRRTFESNISIYVHAPVPVPPVKVDRGQLEGALLNIALNARDAMPDGGTVTIRAGTAMLGAGDVGTLPPGKYVTIALTDTGHGMTPDILERAMLPFFTTRDVGKGTGLGLSAVHGFVVQSGGDVRIISEAGRGTTVTVYLPACEEALTLASNDVAGRAARRSGNILLVEDDPLVQGTVQNRLERLGYRVETANNAAAALDILERDGAASRFDLLFSDVMMPGMNGADLAREVQKRWPQIKVLLTSGYTESGVLGRVAIPPGLALLSKPYSSNDLIQAIDRTLA